MADKTTPSEEPLTTAQLPKQAQDTTSENPPEGRPRRSSAVEQFNQIAAEYDAQIKALEDLPEMRNFRFPEESFTTVPGRELVIDRSINPMAEFDEEEDAAAEPLTEETASAFLRQAEILKLQADLKREAQGGE